MEKEKTGEDPATEEEHQDDSAPQPEPEPHEDEQDEDECDEAIGQLLADIAQLESRVSQLESKLEQHGIEFEHTKRVEPGTTDGSEPTPEERHFYFKRIGKR